MSIAKLFYENLKMDIGYFYYANNKYLGDSRALTMQSWSLVVVERIVQLLSRLVWLY